MIVRFSSMVIFWSHFFFSSCTNIEICDLLIEKTTFYDIETQLRLRDAPSWASTLLTILTTLKLKTKKQKWKQSDEQLWCMVR